MNNFEVFKQYWDKEIRPLAVKCCEGSELIRQLEEAKTQPERQAIAKKMDDYGKKDWLAPWYISQMIFYVEHDLADDRDPRVRTFQVRGCLNSQDYYRDVFKGQDCEEMKNYRTLAGKLNEALSLS